MKTVLLIITALSLTLSAYAGEGKEVTLTGDGVCAHCSLKLTDSCNNALQVKNDEGKLINYILTGKAQKDQHFGAKATPGVTVTGTVSKKDGQKFIKASSLKVKKEKES